MLRKAKRLPVIAMLILITIFLGSLSGCGDSADPLGTATIQFVQEFTGPITPGSPSSGPIITTLAIQPGASTTLTVWVTNFTNSGAVPVIGEKVTFTLLTPGNGAGLTVVNDRTASNGQARAIYTAGNNFATDSVRATTSNGATATITITKTGGIVGARISTLTASATTVGPYQTSTITATVTDGNTIANPILGEPVTFTIPMNQSDACFINASLACVDTITVNTDASGHAVALYRGGGYDPYYDASDTVRAALANGSSSALVIIRSASTPPVPLSISVTAFPSVVNAGQTSTITATLTGDGKAGVLVDFSLAVNNSGASLSASSAVTDGSGNAVVTYVAGGNNPTLTVGDAVQASVGSISSSAAITRSGSAVPPPTTGLSVSVAAAPASVAAGQTSIITATVTGDDSAGAAVTFSIPVNASGASFINASGAGVATITVTASGSGIATAIYQAGSTSPTTSVQDTVRAALTNGANAAAIITRTGTATTTYTVSLAASATSVTAGQVSILTATVTSGTTPAGGVTVTFTLPVNPSTATLTTPSGTGVTVTATTDSAGKAVATYQPGTATPTITVQDTVQAAVGSATSSVAITRVGSATSGFSITVTAAPNPLLTALIGGSSIVTANVKNNLGTVITGVVVTFTSSAGNLNGVPLGPVTVTTDGSGNAVAVFTTTVAGAGTGTTAGIVTASITPVVGTTYTASVVITYP